MLCVFLAIKFDESQNGTVNDLLDSSETDKRRMFFGGMSFSLSLGARRHGQGGQVPPGNVEKCFTANIVSNLSGRSIYAF